MHGRREEVISDETLRSMVRNWAPDAERTAKGFYKNISVIARVDPFTLESKGSPPSVKSALATARPPKSNVPLPVTAG